MFKNFTLILLLLGTLYSKDVIETSEYCKTNWSKGTIECTGESEEGQSSFASKRVSVVIAQRNLLEYVKGVKIDSTTTIQDGMLKSDIITSSVTGIVKGAQILSNNYNQSSSYAKATLKIELGKDLLNALLKKDSISTLDEFTKKLMNNILTSKLYAKESYSQQEKNTIKKLINDFKEDDNKKAQKYLETLMSNFNSKVYSGILIDARDIKDLELALNLKIVNSKGKEIYPSTVVEKKNFIDKNGVSVALDYDINDARKNSRVLKIPIEMKAISTFKKKKSDLVLSEKDIQTLNNYQLLLQKAKIIVVVSE